MIRDQCYKAFLYVISEFCTKLECLLEQAGEACQGQTLQLVMKISKLRPKTKKFYIIDSFLNDTVATIGERK
jgi:hypothetical protein